MGDCNCQNKKENMNNLNQVSTPQGPRADVTIQAVSTGWEANGSACGYDSGVTAFTFVLDNSASGTATLYRMFDANGINDAISGVAGAPADSGTITPSVIVASTVNAPIMITGFNYQTSATAGQFGQALDIVHGEINGTQKKTPNITASAKRNSQFDPLLLTIDQKVFVTGKTAIELNVLAGEIVTLTFFVHNVCNRKPC